MPREALESKIRTNIMLPLRVFVQMQLFAYNPAVNHATNSGLSGLVISNWQDALREMRASPESFIYPLDKELSDMSAEERIIDCRNRIINGEAISQEEYKEILTILRKERGMIKNVSRSNGVKTQTMLPKGKEELKAALLGNLGIGGKKE